MKNLTHTFIKSKSVVASASISPQRTVITFNGTGADENDLIPLVQQIAPDVNILGLRGPYSLNRWVDSPVGVKFHLEKVKKDGVILQQQLQKHAQNYNFNLVTSTLLGFSNGANFILAFAYLFPQFINSAVCMHCMQPFEFSQNNDFSNSRILLTHGTLDQFSSQQQVEQVEQYFTKNNADAELFTYEGDHFYVGQSELQKLKKFLTL